MVVDLGRLGAGWFENSIQADGPSTRTYVSALSSVVPPLHPRYVWSKSATYRAMNASAASSSRSPTQARRIAVTLSCCSGVRSPTRTPSGSGKGPSLPGPSSRSSKLPLISAAASSLSLSTSSAAMTDVRSSSRGAYETPSRSNCGGSTPVKVGEWLTSWPA